MTPDVISVPVRRADEKDKCPILPENGSGLKVKYIATGTVWEGIRKGTFGNRCRYIQDSLKGTDEEVNSVCIFRM
jgi:hypothetical protein